MVPLRNRATPAQNMILRMIEGACQNAADAHPTLKFDRRLIRSIGKRAAGTLTSQWGAVLARSKVGSESAGSIGSAASTTEPTTPAIVARGASRWSWRTPLWVLHRTLSDEIGDARRNGDLERAATLIEVARVVGLMMKLAKPPNRLTKYRLGEHHTR